MTQNELWNIIGHVHLVSLTSAVENFPRKNAVRPDLHLFFLDARWLGKKLKWIYLKIVQTYVKSIIYIYIYQ